MTRIESLALRWHAARRERLRAQKALSKASAESTGWTPMEILSALEGQKKEARRLESRALRELSKACSELRLQADVAVDGVLRPRLCNDVIDI